MKPLIILTTVVLLFAVSACAKQPTITVVEPTPETTPKPSIGVVDQLPSFSRYYDIHRVIDLELGTVCYVLDEDDHFECLQLDLSMIDVAAIEELRRRLD